MKTKATYVDKPLAILSLAVVFVSVAALPAGNVSPILVTAKGFPSTVKLDSSTCCQARRVIAILA